MLARRRRPFKPSGALYALRGNLAPDGAVVKLAGTERTRAPGPARVFDSEEACVAAVRSGGVEPGDVLVVRYEGPAGGPGMREMLSVTSVRRRRRAGRERGARHRRALLGRTRGLMIGHVSPEAARGGPLAAVRDGDRIVIDTDAGRAAVELADAELAARLAAWTPPAARAAGRLRPLPRAAVGSASEGAVLHSGQLAASASASRST